MFLDHEVTSETPVTISQRNDTVRVPGNVTPDMISQRNDNS